MKMVLVAGVILFAVVGPLSISDGKGADVEKVYVIEKPAVVGGNDFYVSNR
ncbi:hypothetical protein HQ563_18970, partial [bacterium]|nr:hypothetical protein [bacterium]